MKTRKLKALIKDLELQIDYLVGYSPQGWHWKREYYFRKQLIDETLTHEQTPPDVVEKINRIQEKIFEIKRKDQPHAQEYLNYEDDEFKVTHQVQVNDRQNNNFYTIEI